MVRSKDSPQAPAAKIPKKGNKQSLRKWGARRGSSGPRGPKFTGRQLFTLAGIKIPERVGRGGCRRTAVFGRGGRGGGSSGTAARARTRGQAHRDPARLGDRAPSIARGYASRPGPWRSEGDQLPILPRRSTGHMVHFQAPLVRPRRRTQSRYTSVTTVDIFLPAAATGSGGTASIRLPSASTFCLRMPTKSA